MNNKELKAKVAEISRIIEAFNFGKAFNELKALNSDNLYIKKAISDLRYGHINDAYEALDDFKNSIDNKSYF